MQRLHRILVPTDFSPVSQTAMEAAVSLADRTSSDLFLVHAIEPVAVLPPLEMSAIPALPTDDGAAARRRLERMPVPNRLSQIVLHRDVVHGDPDRVILDFAETHDIDVIVMGTHSRSGLSHFFLGSVAESVIRHSKCPVLTVPAPEASESGRNADGAMN